MKILAKTTNTAEMLFNIEFWNLSIDFNIVLLAAF